MAQVGTLLFVVAALGEFRTRAGVDVGEEIGAVVNQAAEIELEALAETSGHLLFKQPDVVLGDAVHMIPEVLRGQPSGIGGEETGEGGLPIPIGKVEFAGGGDSAIDGGE